MPEVIAKAVVPRTPHPPKRGIGPASSAFLTTSVLSFFIFSLALPATITGEDAGELTVAAYFLGIPHPPGYPTWCLMAHPFTWLPWGTAAFRVALASAVYGALAAGMVSLITFELCASAFASVLAGMCFACARPVFDQAVITEVYMLNALFFSACVYALLRWTRDRRDYWLLALGLLVGLGQGVHNTMTVLAGVFALYVFCLEPRIVLQPRRILPPIALFALGGSVYLYLPLRSAAHPPVDWGHPATWENFWAMVRRDQFAFMYSTRPRTAETLMQQLSDAGAVLLGSELGGPWRLAAVVPLIGIGGLVMLFRKALRKALLITGTGIVPLLVVIWMQNPTRTAEWIEVMQPFYIPAIWLLAIGAGACVGDILHRRAGQALAGILTLGVAVSLCLILALHSLFPPQNWADRYARNLLEQLPPNAILFAGPDHAAFPILYLQAVEHLRPDVTQGTPYGYADVSLIPDAPPELLAELGEKPRRGMDGKYFAWLLTHTDRPVYFSAIPQLPDDVNIAFRQEGLLYRALKPGKDTAPTWPATYQWPLPEQKICDSFIHEYTTRQIASEYHLKRAQYELAMGDKKEFPMRMRALRGLAYNDPEYLNNAAILLAKHGDLATATTFWEEALACDPTNETVRANLEKAKAR